MKSIQRLAVPILAAGILAILSSCSERTPTDLDLAKAPADPLVFDDAYSPDVYFQPFYQTVVNAVQVDSVQAHGDFAFDGARSLKISVPPQNSALGIYAGGVFTASGVRDLTGYNALTFWAKASEDISLDIAGFGNDNTGTSLYEAGRGNVALTRDWKFIVVPIPAPSKLIAERGLFTFAEGLEQNPPGSGNFPYPDGYDIWVDDLRFAKLGNVEVYRAIMPSVNRSSFVGSSVDLGEPNTVFLVDDAFVTVSHSLGYFDFVSSDPAVARITGGTIEIVGAGSASITATREGEPVQGAANITAYAPPDGPAPTPTLPASDVISMFSDAYVDRPVATWRADWGGVTTRVDDYAVDGNVGKLYSSLNFVGVDFQAALIDASQMTHFHLDAFAPSGTNFRVKLVCFPADGPGVETGDLILTATSTPSFEPGSWQSLDIPLVDFTLPAGWDWSRVGQIVFSSSNAQLVLLDNIYWHK